MELNSAAVFLTASILYTMGCLVILIAIVVGNNIIHKFWKSFGWKFFPTWISDESHFVSRQELSRIAPILDKEEPKK